MSAKWNDQRAKWQIEVSSVLNDSEPEAFEGDVFINAGGILNDWKWPDIEGLENFEGNLIHSAAWVSVHLNPSQKILFVHMG